MKEILKMFLLFFSSSLLSADECGVHPKAKELAEILLNSKIQQHPNLVCNSQLAQAANAKAKLMAENKRVDHVLNYQSPNQHLKSYGLDLPNIYEPIGNQVEAISGGMKTALNTFDYFMSSPSHKAHLLGENEFYKTQNQMAVGYYYDFYTPHEHYWVVYITGLDDESTAEYSFAEVPSK